MGAYDARPNPEASARCFLTSDIACVCWSLCADITRANRVGSADPFVAEVLSPPNSIDKLGAHLAFQLLQDLFATLRTCFAVQPCHGLAISIEIALPLRERVVGHALFGLPRPALRFTNSLHAPGHESRASQLANSKTYTLRDRPPNPNT